MTSYYEIKVVKLNPEASCRENPKIHVPHWVSLQSQKLKSILKHADWTYKSVASLRRSGLKPRNYLRTSVIASFTIISPYLGKKPS
jgi:hypothetical protein